MPGSSLFPFASAKRAPGASRKGEREPFGSVEGNHREQRALDNASLLLPEDRNEEQSEWGTSSRISPNGIDKKSQSGLKPAVGLQRLRRSRMISEPTIESAGSQRPRNRLRDQCSSSTMHSFYDSKTSPLAVSQQTSASSARDFARRKGRSLAVPALLADDTGTSKCDDLGRSANRPRRKRPSRLDLSMLFAKPFPRSGPLLSPQRYVDSPAPLSTTSDIPFKELRMQSFFDDTEANHAQVHTLSTVENMLQHRESVASSSLKEIVQKPQSNTRKWFHDSRIDSSDEKKHPEPEMQADFVETAFQTASCKVASVTSPLRDTAPKQCVCRGRHDDHKQLEGGKPIITPRRKTSSDAQVSDITSGKVDRPRDTAVRSRSPVSDLAKGTPTAFEFANLHEESVFCSSSDDDDDFLLQHQRRSLKRAPLLRSRRDIESSKSDFETRSVEPTETSFFRENSTASTRYRIRRAPPTTPQAPSYTAIEIPERTSSKQAGSPTERQAILPGSIYCKTGLISADQFDHDPLSCRQTKRAAVAPPQKQGSLIMALTPQEYSLLEAMRSKKISRRRPCPTEAHVDLVEPFAQSETWLRQSPYLGYPPGPMVAGGKPLGQGGNCIEARKQCPSNAAPTEPSLPSGRASLIFSESRSSPTTGRESPTTPTLDSIQDMQISQSLGEYYDGSFRRIKDNHVGHVCYKPGSNPLVVLDPFQTARKENFECEGYPWTYTGVAGRRDSAMFH